MGIFGVAISLSNMLWFIPDAFKELVYHNSAKEVKPRETLSFVVINMVICIVICAGFALVGREFLGILYGDEYRAAYYSVLTVFVGIIPMVAFKLIHPIYVNEGKPLIVVLLLAASIMSNVIASFYLIPTYGSLGAAVSTVVSYAVCGLLFVLLFFKDYSLRLRDISVGISQLFSDLKK